MDIDERRSDAGDNFLNVQVGEFIPVVDDHLKPKLGMTFDTLELAENFYNNYATCGGFQMRKGSTKLKGTVEVDKSFVCNKAGISKIKSNDVRRGTTSRSDCKALIRVKLNEETHSWVLYSLTELHNHVFTSPGRRHLLPRNRNVSDSDKVIMDQLTQANIPTCKQMIFFENSSGGHDRVGFTETRAKNHERDLREAMKGHDGQMLIDFFNWQKEIDPTFFYDFQLDELGRLSHCIWVDGIARKNYEVFGDVVSFDATYSTNRYGMLFVPFVGINHHWQSVFLGCGFIPNETASSFIWLFQKWLVAMKHAPFGMVTDQDRGISAAIKAVFPEIRHRFCIWHILDKIPQEVPKMNQDVEFMKAFKNIVYNSDDCTTFEENCKSLLCKYGVENNKWLQDKFEIREKWAPVYHRPHFWAGMSSTQRSEGMNAFLKKHTQKKYSLHEFAVIFERVIARQREQELQENHRTIEKKPKLKTEWYIEAQMAQVYTLVIFYDFQEELKSSLIYNVNLVQEDVNQAIYLVKKCGETENAKVVTYSKETQMAMCACLLFEFVGIPCKHLLAYLKFTDHKELPKQYILRRWTRDVIRRSNIFTNGRGLHEGSSENLGSRYCELTKLAQQQVDIGLASNEGYEFMRNNMIKSIEGFHLVQPESSGPAFGKSMEKSKVLVEEPKQCNTKGRPNGKRLKPTREKVRKPRWCKACGTRGLHDSRNCPNNLEGGRIGHEVDHSSGESTDDNVA